MAAALDITPITITVQNLAGDALDVTIGRNATLHDLKQRLLAANFIEGHEYDIILFKPRPGNNGSNPIRFGDWIGLDSLQQVGIQNGDTIYVFVEIDDTPPPSTTPELRRTYAENRGGKRYRFRKTRSRKTRSRKTRSRKTRSRR